MNQKSIFFSVSGAAFALILIGVACTSSTATPLPVACSTVEPIDFTPQSGGGISWVDGSIFRYIPSGTFLMGQDEIDPSDHSPSHTVDLDAYWIQQEEVTNRMYNRCVELGICAPPFPEEWVPYWYAFPGHADDPVVGVDWFQAESYCEWIGGSLPTEAQWEKAARGMDGSPYPWGVDDPTCDLLNFDDCLEPSAPIRVGSYLLGISFFNIYDMAGNVSEWVHDWYAHDYYPMSPLENPTGPTEGELRTYRGSNYAGPVEAVPLFLRHAIEPQDHDATLGFRCVLTGEAVGNPPPPACELPAYSPPEMGYQPPEIPDPLNAEALGYCFPGDDNVPNGYINIEFDQPVDASDFNITANVPIPQIIQDNDHPETIILVDMPVDAVSEITVCPVVPMSPPEPSEPLCPVNYYLDTITGTCRYMITPPDDTCHEGQVWLEGYGYVYPAVDPLEQFLLVLGCYIFPGYEVVPISESPLSLACLPVDGFSGCEDDPDCSLSTSCLPGMTLQSEENCCLQPESFEPVCLTGYEYDPAQKLCVQKDPADQCLSFSIFVPTCEAPVVIPRCQNPDQYKDPRSCAEAGCRWVPAALVPPYCALP